MKSRLLLDIVITQGSSIFQLLSSKDKSLLVGRNSFLVLNLCLHVFNCVWSFDLKCDGLSRQSLDEDLHSSSQSKNEMKSGFLLNVVVTECPSIFQLLSCEDQSLLIRRDSFLVLDLGLDVFNGIRSFDLKSNSFSSKSFDEDLHSSSQSKDQMKGWLLLNVVVGQSSSIFQLLSCEDQSLLIRGNSFLVLDFGLYIFNGIRGLNFEGNGLSSQCLDEDLHSSSQSKDQMKGWLLLNVVVGQSPSILELFASEDQSLLIRRDTLFVLNLSLDVFNGVRGLDFEGNCLSSKSFDEDLHLESCGNQMMKQY